MYTDKMDLSADKHVFRYRGVPNPANKTDQIMPKQPYISEQNRIQLEQAGLLAVKTAEKYRSINHTADPHQSTFEDLALSLHELTLCQPVMPDKTPTIADLSIKAAIDSASKRCEKPGFGYVERLKSLQYVTKIVAEVGSMCLEEARLTKPHEFSND